MVFCENCEIWDVWFVWVVNFIVLFIRYNRVKDGGCIFFLRIFNVGINFFLCYLFVILLIFIGKYYVIILNWVNVEKGFFFGKIFLDWVLEVIWILNYDLRLYNFLIGF